MWSYYDANTKDTKNVSIILPTQKTQKNLSDLVSFVLMS